MTRRRLGIDIGGTFTDIVFLDEDGAMVTRKVSSSSDDYARAIAASLAETFASDPIDASDVVEVLHGTTVASNAILEHRGARTGLITTEGFRDVLELRNLRMPRLYDLTWEKPAPLVPRYLRLTVGERVTGTGEIRRALDGDEVARVIDRLVSEDVEIVAVCLINAYANPAHERLIQAVAAERAPSLRCCLSSEVLPEMKEYERTSTTVVNAYVTPVVSDYLGRMRGELDRTGITAPLLLMQSSGGLVSADSAREKPVNIIESGPAGGVVGAHAVARRLGLDDIISFDMGGTTAKASLVEHGSFSRSPDFQVGGGILTGSRLLTGAGYLLKLPAIDLAEVGAGGGSLVQVDAGGGMQVGPRSAGADPGPVCYGRGGTEPTVTDANVVLGYLNPEHLVGGALPIDASLSREALAERVAGPLGLTLEQAALGAHRIAVSNMMRAIRAVSSERGRDPRRFSLFAFGGNGPLFASTMARTLGIAEVIVPPAPGLFSAFGLLYADVEHHYSRSCLRRLDEADPAELDGYWSALESEARAQLQAEGFDEAHVQIQRAASLHYKGQIYELTVTAPDGPLDRDALTELAERFAREHETTYGHRASEDEPVEVVHLELNARGLTDTPRVPSRLHGVQAVVAGARTRDAYFGDDGWLETPVIGRGDLTSAREGPLIVEEYDATCLIPPGATARLDEGDNIRIRVDSD